MLEAIGDFISGLLQTILGIFLLWLYFFAPNDKTKNDSDSEKCTARFIRTRRYIFKD